MMLQKRGRMWLASGCYFRTHIIYRHPWLRESTEYRPSIYQIYLRNKASVLFMHVLRLPSSASPYGGTKCLWNRSTPNPDSMINLADVHDIRAKVTLQLKSLALSGWTMIHGYIFIATSTHESNELISGIILTGQYPQLYPNRHYS